jgi:hypothetical protein
LVRELGVGGVLCFLEVDFPDAMKGERFQIRVDLDGVHGKSPYALETVSSIRPGSRIDGQCYGGALGTCVRSVSEMVIGEVTGDRCMCGKFTVDGSHSLQIERMFEVLFQVAGEEAHGEDVVVKGDTERSLEVVLVVELQVPGFRR